MLLKSFMKVNSSTRIYFIIWLESDYNKKGATTLDSFTLDYSAPIKSKEWQIPFWRYDSLKEVGAKVQTLSPFGNDTICLVVTVKNSTEYFDLVDKQLASYGYKSERR